jgi:hypothetical protein
MSELEGAGHSTDRRVRVVLGVVVGACVVIFAWFVTLGRLDFFARAPLADIFDTQARSILDGRLHAGTNAYGFETFIVDGRGYTYFGVFPSLLRMPVMLVTDSYDGRFTAASMLLGYVVAMVSVALIIVRIRRLARPEAEWTTRALVFAAALLALVGLGSNIFFLASATRVYYEAAMWGAAGVLVSFAAALGFLLDPTRRRRILWAGLGAAVAWLSRGSVGLAPSIVLGLFGLTYLVNWRFLDAVAPRPQQPEEGQERGDRDRRVGAFLVAAAIVPALAFGAVNMAKFGSPTALPFDKMEAAKTKPERVEVLDRYGGDMSSPAVVPAHLVQDFRPDLVEFDRVWPFVHLSPQDPPGVGDAFFDTVEPTAGLTVTAPALLVLAAVGAVPILRRRRGDDGGLACLRPFLLGGLVPVVVVASLAFIAQRYLTDIVPLLVVAAAAGAVTLEAATERRAAAAASSSVRRWAPLAGVGALVLVGVYMTVSLTWVLQRFVTPPDIGGLAAGLRTQAAMADVAGVRAPQIVRVDALPSKGTPGQIVVVGDCDGLYEADADGGWFPIEAGPARGHFAVELTLDEPLGTDPVVVLTAGTRRDYVVIGLEAYSDDEVRLVADRTGNLSEGPPFRLAVGETYRIDVWADPEHLITVDVDGRSRFTSFNSKPPALTEAKVGRNPYGGPIDEDVPGDLREAAVPMPTCEALGN